MKALLDINDGDVAVVNFTTPDCVNSLYEGTICDWGAYNQNASKTASQSQTNQSLTNGDEGYGSAHVIDDTVTVGGKSFPGMTVVVRGQDCKQFDSFAHLK